jgi:long-chain acyl-CoA synthetase
MTESFNPRYTDLVTMFRDSVERFADRPLYGVRKSDGWTWYTYKQAGEMVDAFRAALAGLGVGRGDRVACVSNNRLEWVIACNAVESLGATWVPMYENQHEKEQKYILTDSGAKVCLAGSAGAEKTIRALQAEVPGLKEVIGFSDESEGGFWKRLEAGKAHPVPPVRPDGKDVYSIVYTSGTTGTPKGVRLTHESLAKGIEAAKMVIPFVPDDRSVSFLPWAHVFGGHLELNTLMSIGASMAICESPDKLLEMVAEVKPTLLVAVPRVWNRIHSVVQKSIAEQPAPLRWIFASAMRAASKERRGERAGVLDKAALAIARKMIFAKVVAKFGGRLKYAVSGAAALSREVAEFVDTLGINVFEGYAMTETGGVGTINMPRAKRIGSVGKAVPGVRIELDRTAVGGDAEQGEIVILGHCIMDGYHNHPDETKAALTPEGGLRTGDLGKFDADGFLYVTGRVKELYKLENGKYIAPAPLEEQLTLSPYIAQAMIYGSNRPHNVAILVPDVAALRDWARANHVPHDDVAKLLEDERVKKLIAGELEKHSAEWKGFERIRNFALLSEEFSTTNDMLTPTLKVKRRNILKRYGDRIDSLYGAKS